MVDTGKSIAPNRELSAEQAKATMRKAAVRLLPLLFLSYVANLLDRSNVGFAKLTMQADLGMSDAAYAFGTGMFYFGYLVFEVPSNLILLYFTVAFCANAGGLYLPELIRNHFPDSSKLQIGLLAAIPSLCGLVGMLVNGAWSDWTRKYRLHVALPALMAAGGWLLAALAESQAWALGGLSLAFMGVMSMLPPFWSLPTSFLSGAAAAGGIALINSVGNIGRLLGPWSMGLIHDAMGSHFYGLLTLAATLVLTGALAPFGAFFQASA